MRRFKFVAGALLLLAVLMASGCYTVLRHPTGSDVVSQDSYGRTCSDCHADAQFYHPYYRYGSSYNRWNDYYGSPWWYDNYWWWDHNDGHNDDGSQPGNVETGERHLWSSGGWASGGWGFTKPSGTSTPSAPSRPKDGKVDDSKDSGSDDSKDSAKTEEKPSLWKNKDKKKGF